MKYLPVVISNGHTNAVKRWRNAGLDMSEAVWVVPPEQISMYRAAGAQNFQPVERPGVSAARNEALKAAWMHDVACLLLDDDPVKAQWVYQSARASDITWLRLFEKLAKTQEMYDVYLATANRTTNPFFVTKQIEFNKSCAGGVMMIRPCDLWFDEQLPVMEDIDYGMQHSVRYGSWMRVSELLAHMERNRPGSVLEQQRANGINALGNERMVKKWGGDVVTAHTQHGVQTRTKYRRETLD